MKVANLFNYATSELSQDAMICYLLEWGKHEYISENNTLHSIAINFIDSLFAKFPEISKPSIYSKIIIKKQYHNIDVLCIINDEYSIIIEDKTNTKKHSDQLIRYFKRIEKDFSETKILPIYFKTGDQSDYTSIIDDKYQVYTRKDFLTILNERNSNNDIISNFTDHLNSIENKINSYKLLSIDDWNYSSWKGFYIALQKKLGEGKWDYVPNANGGFLGFWWNWQEKDNYWVYLQIDHSSKKLLLRLCGKDKVKLTKDIRNKWKKHVFFNENEIQIEKPTRISSGNCVTVGVLKNEFRITDLNNIVNIDKTVEFLKKVEIIKNNKVKSL